MVKITTSFLLCNSESLSHTQQHCCDIFAEYIVTYTPIYECVDAASSGSSPARDEHMCAHNQLGTGPVDYMRTQTERYIVS